MKLEDIEEKEDRYRLVFLKKDKDFVLSHLHELKGRFIYSYDRKMFTNIIYDTECTKEEINDFIEKYMNYLATFETYDKRYD